jgi:hypothetical protein
MLPTHDIHMKIIVLYIGYIYVGTLLKELVENSGIEHKSLD